MAVLTISREIGSEGPYIGKKVAEKMGYKYADKKTIHNVFHQYGFIPFERVYEAPTSFWDQFDDMRRLTLQNLNSVIRGLACFGDIVIVGRGSFAVLEGLDDVLNVRIQAPFEHRVRVFMEIEKITDRDKAAKLLEEKGSLRSAFVESTYQTPWDSASNFDIVINTDKIPPETAVEWLCQTLKDMEKKEYILEKTAKAFSVEPYLETAVKGVLRWND